MNDKKKQEKLLRHKRKREQKRKGTAYLRLLDDQSELYGCWLNQDWQNAGVAYIIVARKTTTGLLMFGTFWLDMVKKIVKNTSASVNITTDVFHRVVLNKDKGIEFFNANLELVKEIIAGVLYQTSEELPENFDECLKLVGSLDEYLEKLKKEEAVVSTEQEFKGVRILYDVTDRDLVETELRQFSDLEEVEDSNTMQRRFIWRCLDTKKIFSLKRERLPVANVILQENSLILEIYQDKYREHLQNTILKSLGTSINLHK